MFVTLKFEIPNLTVAEAKQMIHEYDKQWTETPVDPEKTTAEDLVSLILVGEGPQDYDVVLNEWVD